MPTSYRTMTECFFIAAPPDEVWRVLADPRSALEPHETEVILEAPVKLGVGDSWVEQHGEECDNDRVSWRTIVADRPHTYAMRGSQRGITIVSESTLTAVEGGTLLEDRTTFFPSFAGRFPQQLLPWVLVAVGVLPKIAADGERDIEYAASIGRALGCRAERR